MIWAVELEYWGQGGPVFRRLIFTQDPNMLDDARTSCLLEATLYGADVYGEDV